MSESYKNLIDQSKVYEAIEPTSLDYAANLSRRFGSHIWLKREDQLPVFSFKLRGAYNKMAQLSKQQLAAGVIAASAGNHAQGVALSAKLLGTKATIVMPATTPQIKVDAVRNHGAEVVLHGDSYSDAQVLANQLLVERGLTFISPYDDPLVIAGQGTVGKEILDQHAGELEAIFVPIGGGGLVAGIASYVKAVRPEVKIIGVEPADADAMDRSIRAGKRVVLDEVGIFADGVAVKQVGELTFEIARELIDEIVLVTTDEMCAAIKDIFEDTRTIQEPAGALSIAGAKKWLVENNRQGVDVIAIASGANMNFDRLRHVAERTEIGERREGIVAVTIPERPGSFRTFCRALGSFNITEFNYRYADEHDANVYVGLQLKSADDLSSILASLQAAEYQAVDLTDNEIAKVHVRHMLGGHAGRAANERLFRFRFPERPGALLDFLDALGDRWNISLFHYRNHGTDFGRVLCGVQVAPDDHEAFAGFLETLGYYYAEETDNPAYTIFLS